MESCWGSIIEYWHKNYGLTIINNKKEASQEEHNLPKNFKDFYRHKMVVTNTLSTLT